MRNLHGFKSEYPSSDWIGKGENSSSKRADTQMHMLPIRCCRVKEGGVWSDAGAWRGPDVS
jgi:hypothetical protein